MGLGGCYCLLKYLFFFVNLVFWVVGLTVVVLSVWMLTDPTFYISMAQDESSYYSGVYLFLIMGVSMCITGFLGCCGAIRESQCMLLLFPGVIIIIQMAGISAVAWGYSNCETLEKLVKENVEITVLQEYGVVQSRTSTFDAIQQGLECCGAKGPSDWLGSKYNHAESQQVHLAISSVPQIYNIPSSCCSGDPHSVACLNAQKISIAGPIPPPIFTDGCGEKLVEALREHVSVLLIIGLLILSIQTFGMVCSVILYCGVHKRNQYKA